MNPTRQDPISQRRLTKKVANEKIIFMDRTRDESRRLFLAAEGEGGVPGTVCCMKNDTRLVSFTITTQSTATTILYKRNLSMNVHRYKRRDAEAIAAHSSH